MASGFGAEFELELVGCVACCVLRLGEIPVSSFIIASILAQKKWVL
jgi:hypothetical protein